MDRSDDDFSRTPWRYPGTPAPHGGLLHDGALRPLTPRHGRPLGQAEVGDASLDEALVRAGAARTTERHLVVAVGSNATPAVMARKLTAGRASTTVAFLAVTVHGLAVGHSAHVSRPGYVPATPRLAAQAATRLFASLLDDDQLTCIVQTEPNYVRRPVPPERCRLEIEGAGRVASFWVFDSIWGVLAPPGQPPWPVLPQEQLIARLAQECPGFATLVGSADDPRRMMASLGADTALRTRVTEMFRTESWSRPSGLIA